MTKMEEELVSRVNMGESTENVRNVLRHLVTQAKQFGAGSVASTFWFQNEDDRIKDTEFVPYVSYGVKLKSEVE